MNNTARSNSGLPELATRAQSLHGEIVATRKRGLSLAMDAGDVLINAKELVPHGGWSDWLASVGINARTAQLYMQVSRGRDDLKSATVAGLREAAEWLAERAKVEEIVRRVDTAGDESVCIDCRVAGGGCLLVTFWRRKSGSYFIGWVRGSIDESGEVEDINGEAAAFKKPVTAETGAKILRRFYPQYRVVHSCAVSDDDAQHDIQLSGLRVVSHPWGERLEEAA